MIRDPRKRTRTPKNEALTAEQIMGYDALKAWRKAWADERDLPAFIVLGNRSLEALARTIPHQIPKTLTALESIYGFGPKKIERLGAEVLKVLKQFG